MLKFTFNLKLGLVMSDNLQIEDTKISNINDWDFLKAVSFMALLHKSVSYQNISQTGIILIV